MPEVTMIAASFENVTLAEIGRDRLRRHQARAAGKLRIVGTAPGPQASERVVVAGPVLADALDAVRVIVDELGGSLIVVV